VSNLGPQLVPWWGKNILREGGKRTFWRGAKYTTYNKINNNSKNFKGQVCCWEGGKIPYPSLLRA